MLQNVCTTRDACAVVMSASLLLFGPATAILDRFLHHAEIITITGQSYRLKDRAVNNNTKKEKDNNDSARKKSKPD